MTIVSGIRFWIAFKIGSASRREEGPAPLGVGSERTSSRWTQMAKQNCSAGKPEGRGAISALHGPLPSTRFGTAR
ncbi:MAG: hypothetical protein V4492_03265 [Chlamydiota bacterium]